GFGAIQEFRAGKDRDQAALNAGFEIAAGAGILEESQRSGKVLVGHRPAEGPMRHIGEDLGRAGGFIRIRRRVADKNALTIGSLDRRANRTVGSGDLQAPAAAPSASAAAS